MQNLSTRLRMFDEHKRCVPCRGFGIGRCLPSVRIPGLCLILFHTNMWRHLGSQLLPTPVGRHQFECGCRQSMPVSLTLKIIIKKSWTGNAQTCYNSPNYIRCHVARHILPSKTKCFHPSCWRTKLCNSEESKTDCGSSHVTCNWFAFLVEVHFDWTRIEIRKV